MRPHFDRLKLSLVRPPVSVYDGINHYRRGAFPVGLREKTKMRLADELTKQGASVRPTKSGYKAMTPLGIMCSTRYGDMLLRRDVERLGLTWPFGK
jgi:hypothetical protein